MDEASNDLVPTKHTIDGHALAWRAAVAAAVTVLVTGGLVWWIESSDVPADRQLTAVLDAVKIGLSVGAGLGGLFALYLAWRRQQSTEADHARQERALEHQRETAKETQAHQERVAVATEADAAARRVTDLYTKAIEQVGSDKAVVRLGGLYALERLAQDNEEQRQMIVNVLCAYLGTPYTPPETGDHGTREEYGERVRERGVRMAAQRILYGHLSPGESAESPVETFWQDIDLSLDNATLIDFEFKDCRVRRATFENAKFVGTATFKQTEFTGDAQFSRATFDGVACFDGAEFGEETHVGDDVEIGEDSHFSNNVKFENESRFCGANFKSDAMFERAILWQGSSFDDAIFGGRVSFYRTKLNGTRSFDRVTFKVSMPHEQVEILPRELWVLVDQEAKRDHLKDS